MRETLDIPEAYHLLQIKVEEEAEFLEGERDEMFHNLVSKLMFMISQFCRDIHMAVSFLTTRIKCLYEDDWGELKIV